MYDQTTLFPDEEENDMGNPLVPLTKIERRKLYTFRKKLEVIEQNCIGIVRAKSNKIIHGILLRMWDRSYEFDPPTKAWLERTVPAFNNWCYAMNEPLCYSNFGVYIATTPKEIEDFRRRYRNPYLNGVAEANDSHQSVIENDPKLEAEYGLRLLQSTDPKDRQKIEKE